MSEAGQVIYWSPAQVKRVEFLEKYLNQYLGKDVGIAELARSQDPGLVSRLQAILLTELRYDGREDWIRENIRSSRGLVEVQQYLDARQEVAELLERLVTASRAYAEWVIWQQREADDRNPWDIGHD